MVGTLAAAGGGRGAASACQYRGTANGNSGWKTRIRGQRRHGERSRSHAGHALASASELACRVRLASKP